MRKLVLSMILVITLCFLSVNRVLAQSTVDTVVTKRADSEKTVKRRGTIVEWKGQSLTLNSNGRDREIDNQEIVRIQTSWSQEYVDGLQLLQVGKAKESIPVFMKAVSSETRPWARRIIRSQLMEAYQLANANAAATEQFMRILVEDRNTRFLDRAPLAWTGSGNLIEQARTWIKSNDPIAQLMGASWLVSGPDRNQAIQILEELARDIDPRIKNLAIAQLWRTRTGVNAKQTQVWAKLVEKMERDIRAGPYFVLAEAQSRAGQIDEALINLMKVRILYPEQRSLSAAALYRAAQLLHNRQQTKEAKTLLSELTSLYPQTIWAQQGNQ